MNRFLTVTIGAAAFSAVACFFSPLPPQSHDTRLEVLHQAFEATANDPAHAVYLFKTAGRGAALESARLSTWFSCLLKTTTTSQDWLSFLEADPPQDLRIRARKELARLTLDLGDLSGAIRILEDPYGVETDLVLLKLPDPDARQRAARRLAVEAPARLRNVSKQLDQGTLSTLSPQEKNSRAQSWLDSGAPSRAIAELRKTKFKGDNEVTRRHIMAACEIAAGRPSRALNLLSSKDTTSARGNLLRARAYKNVAWQRFPRKSSRSSFAACLEAALRIDTEAASQELQIETNEVILECATEIDSFGIAMTAWRQIPSDEDRDRIPWLGRRLGVALAKSGRTDESLEIARRLPAHARCLHYWVGAATGSGSDDLAKSAIHDLYGSWAKTQSKVSSKPYRAVSAITPAPLPPTVQWLVDRGWDNEARREFSRIRKSRKPVGEEALTAAIFESDQGRSNTSIRVLRSGFPELGSVTISQAPINVIHRYLPLRWEKDLVAAAHEVGVDPWLLAGLARQESLFTAHARSNRGAIGVLQLIPSTARMHSRRLKIKPDLLDPAINLRLGAHEIASLIDDYGAIEPALAAYNAGPTRVRRWWKRTPEAQQFTEAVPIPETYTYIRRVVFLTEAYRQVYEEKWEKP